MPDANQISQAVIGAIVIVSTVISYIQARKAKNKVQEIHVMVNSQKTDMEHRIKSLEGKLRLSPGEDIPSPQIITEDTGAHQ